MVWSVYWDTLQPNPGLAGLPVNQHLGNLEGKELRFGTSAGPTFAVMTTAVTCGSVNCMHDSLNPLAGLAPFTGMWLNCVFGGKGVGMINMLIFIIIGVFIAGLMVGRTPEYLGKKVEAREMKLAMLAFLIHPLMVLARPDCLPSPTGEQRPPTTPARTASRKCSTNSLRRRPTTARASKASAIPTASTTTQRPPRTARNGTSPPAS